MRLTKFQNIRFLCFLSLFILIGLNLVLQYGVGRGMHLTFLTWSFYMLCIPIPNSAVATSFILNFFTSKSERYAKLIPWLIAVLLNIFTYFVMPYTYVMSATTFLLYRIISNPWPYWIIIVTSALSGVYGTYFMSKRWVARHFFAKSVLFALGIATFFYLSYVEIVILFCARTG
jgi:hypothetical protein